VKAHFDGQKNKYDFTQKVPKMHRFFISSVLTRTAVGYVRKENYPFKRVFIQCG